MVSSISLLASITSTISSSVKLPNGSFVPITHIGTVQLSPHILLTNVLVIPSFSFDVLSVSYLLKQISYCLTLFHDQLIIQDLHSLKMIGLAKECAGLYHLVQSNTGGLHTASSVSYRI